MNPIMTAYIGLGANLGDAQTTLRHAIAMLGELPHTKVQSVSSFYGSAPMGEGADGPNYTNAVAKLKTTLTAHELLNALQTIETNNGRERSHRNAPRTLDLDILLYGDMVLNDEKLTIPHPRMTERGFVLLPLDEITPDLMWIDASGSQSLKHLLPQIMGQDVVRLKEE